MLDALVSGFESFVDTFTGGNALIGDAVNGALFGAISTGIGGGDILKGAAWGAAGNAISGAGDEGIFNIIGKGVAGYGIDKALGGDGLIGGASGMLAGYLQNNEDPQQAAAPKKEAGEEEQVSIEDKKETTEKGMLERFGLQNSEGDGTLLGKSAVTALGAYGSSMERKDQIEQVAKIREKSDRNKKNLDEEFEQRNLAGFKHPAMIVRNG